MLGRLERPGFGHGPVTAGAELELCLINGQGHALPRNQEVMAETADPGGAEGRPVQPRLERYLEHQRAGAPVHTWPIP